MCRTRVLIVHELWWPRGRGGVLATHLITKMLAKSSFEVRVVTGVRDYEAIDGVEFIYEPRLKTSNKLELWLNTYLLSREDWFRRLIERADIIYIPRYAYSLIPLAKALGKRVIVHLHDYQPVSYTAVIFYNDPFKSDSRRTFYYELHQHGLARALITTPLTQINKLARKWVSQADAVICVSNRQREILEKAMPKIKDKLVVIYNPPPKIPLISKELPEEKILLYLGGSSFIKGFHTVIKAVNEASKKYRDLRVIMTGVKKNIPRQNYIGYEELPYEEVVKLHARAYALLFPSIWEEPLPYVIMESMLLGTIPIASRVGGVPEIVKGTPAEEYMFTPGDAGELLDRVEKLVSQPREAIVDTGMKLREHALRLFNMEEITGVFVNLFESLVSQSS
jgi:glycosyltransferase involved in cell wall biosynthesis